MNRHVLTIGAAVLLLAQASAFPVQAAEFSTIQPYLTADGKIGFTNGSQQVTKAVYEESIQYPSCIIVAAAGKKGILDAKTGKEITPAIWDSIEIPDDGKVAIVQKGGWFQYIDLTTRQLSQEKFVGAHTYYLSQTYPGVIAMGGQKAMLLDPAGKVLLPPFTGKISFFDLLPTAEEGKQAAEAGQGARESTRYVATLTADRSTLYDPMTMQPLFSLENAQFLPQDGVPAATIRVRVNGKEGLVDSKGNYVLEPVYNRLIFLNHGYVRVEGEQGVGLWKDGRMLAEPRYADVATESSTEEVYSTREADTVTYHTLTKKGTQPLKAGAEYLLHGYVLGQDPKTGLYGVVEAGGEVVIPFQYPRVEGPPAGRLFVRSDGKKGLIPANGLPMEEPSVWFDSVTTLGSYSMLSVQDGRNIGLYSDSKGFLLLPKAGRVIHYETDAGYLVKVSEPDGKTLFYRSDGSLVDPQNETSRGLTDTLDASDSRETGTVLIDRETKQAIGKAYSRSLYHDAEANLIVGVDKDAAVADLYTADGKPVTGEVRVPVSPLGSEGPPVIFARLGENVYTVGKRENQDGWALAKLEGEQLSAVSDDVYRDFSVREINGKRLLVLTRKDGMVDLYAQNSEQELTRLEGVASFQTFDSLNALLIKRGAGWDGYSLDLQRLSQGSYSALQWVTTAKGIGTIVYRDGKTGLYGMLGADFRPLTQPLYASIQPADQVFTQRAGVETPPFVFTTNQHFGYLDAQGNELFRTER